MEKRRLLPGSLIFLILFVPSLCFGASFVSCADGNWTNQNTWNVDAAGCGVTASHPDSGDTVTIANGTTVTVNESHNLGTCTVEGNLTLGTGVTATMNGILTIGNGAGKESHFTLGAGSTLDTNGLNVVTNNMMLRSNSTSNNWANVIGSGKIIMGTVYSSELAKQDIDVSYVSFRMTGADGANRSFYSSLGIYGTITTNQAIFTNCVFYGTNSIQVGYSGYTPNTTVIQFINCDFRDFQDGRKVVIVGVSPNSNVLVKGCTFGGGTGSASSLNILQANAVIEDCVFADRFQINTVSVSYNSYKIYRWNFVSSSAFNGGLVYFGTAGGLWQNSYLQTNYLNTHPFIYGTGGVTVQDSIFHQEYESTSEWWGLPGSDSIFSGNICFNIVDLYTGAGSILTSTVDLKNNTCWITWDIPEGVLFASVHAPKVGVTVNAVNNLIAGSLAVQEAIGGTDLTRTINSLTWADGKALAQVTASLYTMAVGTTVVISGATPSGYNGTFTVSDYIDSTHFKYVCDDPGGSSASASMKMMFDVSYSDYNNFYNVTTPYEKTYVNILSGEENDKTIDPEFLDSSRRLEKWNQGHGSGTYSSADAVTYLLGINGYRGTPNFDQQGTKSERGPGHLVEWVRYGFSTTNGLLRNAGDPADGSPTIGAMEWQNPRRKRAM